MATPIPIRRCNGSPYKEGTLGACGELATVVCTSIERLSWFACGELGHRAGAARTESVEAFFAALCGE